MFSRHILIRKATSLFFITLMLFINAIKLFHSHPVNLQNISLINSGHKLHKSGEIRSQNISQDDHCAICDFRLSKDAEPANSFSASTPPQSTIAIFAYILPLRTPAFHLTGQGRAPPVLL
jgi:hypothetical protein